jgi:hypothetical protein
MEGLEAGALVILDLQSVSALHLRPGHGSRDNTAVSG